MSLNSLQSSPFPFSRIDTASNAESERSSPNIPNERDDADVDEPSISVDADTEREDITDDGEDSADDRTYNDAEERGAGITKKVNTQ